MDKEKGYRYLYLLVITKTDLTTLVLLREGFYCRCEREDSQRHLEEARAERASSRLNTANRLDLGQEKHKSKAERAQGREGGGEGWRGGGEGQGYKQNGAGRMGSGSQRAGEV